MTLEQNLEHSGTWLFSHRSYVPLILIPLAGLVIFFSNDFPPPFATNWEWKALSLLVALFGAVIRAYVVGTTPSGTSGRNVDRQIAEALNTTGAYSVARHPLYIGNFVTVLGIVMWTGVWWFILLASILFWFYYERIMYVEERYLRQKFGSSFERWASNTPAVIPALRHFKAAAYPFSIKTVLRREYDGMLAITASFLILEGFEYLNDPHDSQFDLIWVGLFVTMFIVAAILRYMRKHTQLLEVTDR